MAPAPADLAVRVAAHLDIDPAELTPGALLAEDLGVDSLAAIELAMALEDAYEISLPDSVLAQVRTWGDLVRVVGAARADAGRAHR